MMRLSRKLLSVLAFLLFAGMSVKTVYAEGQPEEETPAPAPSSYTYDVVIYQGDQPGFAGTENPVRITVEPGTELDIQFNEAAGGYELTVGETTVTIALPKTDNGGVQEDSIYTPLGIKETGTDNAEVIVSLTGDAAKVNEDKSYVVSYGVTGTLVDYTIIYQTNTGTVLGRSNYKGRVGDKPVVAALSFDGYAPDARNRTRTLTADPSANVFTFTYYPSATGAGDGTGAGGIEYEYITLADGTVAAVPVNGGGNNPAGGANPAAGGNPAGGVAPAGQDGAADDNPGTVDLIDEDVPLANVTDTQPDATTPDVAAAEGHHKGPSRGLLIGGAAAGGLGIVGGVIAFLLRRNTEE